MSNIVTTLGADVDVVNVVNVVNVVVDDESKNFYPNVFVAGGNFYVFFCFRNLLCNQKMQLSAIQNEAPSAADGVTGPGY